MSYTVDIVAPPIAAKDDVAWRELQSFNDTVIEPPTVFRQLHDRLTARFPCLSSLSDDRLDEGVWSYAPLWDCFQYRAAGLNIVFSRVGEVLPFLVATATGLGLVVFDAQTGQIHRPRGYRGLAMTLEGQKLLASPTRDELYGAVDALTPDGGPGFLVLDSAKWGYCQCAGGNGRFTVEWREYEGKAFRHFVAGNRSRPSLTEIAIPTNGYQVTVMENECLNAAEVKQIIEAFANELSRPNAFAWRDITEQFS